MKTFSAIALLAATATALSTTVSVEYFPAAGCKTGGSTITVKSGDANCQNLDFTANSFKITGSTKLPDGCTLQGFSAKKCGGFEEQYIDGPSLNKCDKAADSSGKIKSVRISC